VRFKLSEYDVFDAPTPVPIIAVAIVGVFAAYHFLRVGFDTHPPFGGQQAQMEVANANAPKVEAANLDGGLRYEPPLVPISIELTRRGVSVTLEGKLQTPMGTFAAFSVASVPFQFWLRENAYCRVAGTSICLRARRSSVLRAVTQRPAWQEPIVLRRKRQCQSCNL
jgi:hypothetical protein